MRTIFCGFFVFLSFLDKIPQFNSGHDDKRHRVHESFAPFISLYVYTETGPEGGGNVCPVPEQNLRLEWNHHQHQDGHERKNLVPS